MADKIISSRLKAAFDTLSGVLTATIITLFIFEVFAWAALKVRDSRKRVNYSDETIRTLYDTDDPARYRRMLDETWHQRVPLRYEPYVEFTESGYKSDSINVSPHGERTVPCNPGNGAGPTIFVFGGSTTFGYGVFDSETIPAYIRQILSEDLKKNATVRNFGSGCYYSTAERIRFENMLASGTIPDIVIFIDGLNDFFFFTTPDRSYWSDYIKFSIKSNAFAKFLERSSTVRLLRLFLKKTGAVRYLDNPLDEGKEASAEQILSAAKRLNTNRDIIRSVCVRSGIKVLFVQQPVRSVDHDPARDVIRSRPEMWKGVMNCGAGYAVIRGLLENKEISGEGLLWLTDLSIDGNEYVDTVHYSPAYNRAIAAEIVRYMTDHGYF
jgi:hypothetical protein